MANKKKVLLVIFGNKENYYELFSSVGMLDDETELVIEQASWEDISLTSYPESMIVEIGRQANPFSNTSQDVRTSRTVKPDFILIRNISRGIHGNDHRNILYGIIHSNIPCINSAHSVLCNLERPVVHAALREIENRIGFDQFPLIPQTYYPDYREMNFTPEYPIVVKVGHVHAGYGKMKLDDHHVFEDLKTVMALFPTYLTVEHYYEPEYDLRIQKIGNHYRVYKKISIGSWKSNSGACVVEDIPLTEQYKRWVDEASTIFGGLDICAVDAIHCVKDQKDYILEVNDTAIGLAPHKEEEDLPILRDLVLSRMRSLFAKKQIERPLVAPKQETGEQTVQLELINTKNDLLQAQSDLRKEMEKVERLTLANKEFKSQLVAGQQTKQTAVKQNNSFMNTLVLVLLVLVAILLARLFYSS